MEPYYEADGITIYHGAELGEAILEEVEFSTAAHVHRVDGPVGCHHCRELTK